MPLREVRRGQRFTLLVYVRDNGACPVAEYLDELPTRERKRIDGLLERAAEYGPPRNREQNAPLTGEDFFEFKAYQIRIFWRYASGRRIVLFHGFTKKSGRTPRRELTTGRQRWQETVEELGR